jgi:tetratricopeptide (TPR) repeat protein
LDVGRQLNLQAQVAFSLTHIANTFTFTLRFAEAWPVAQEGRALMEQSADHLHLSQLLTNAIPYHYLHVGDLDAASSTAQQGTEMAARIGNVFWEAIGAWYVGMIAQLRGEYEAAIAAYRRAAQAGRASGAYAMPAIGLAPLAAVYAEISGSSHAPVTALIHEAEVLLADPTKVVPGAQAVRSLGLAALAQGDLDHADAWFQQGLASRTTWRILERPWMLLGAAQVALARQDLEVAMMLAREARDVVETRALQHMAPTVALIVGRIMAAGGEHMAALGQFNAAEALARDMAMRPVVWQARAAAACSQLALGRAEEAQAARHGACAMIDQIAALFEDQELRAAFVEHARQQIV